MLFGGAGALGYLTFGSNAKAVILVNLDQTNKFTQAVSSFTFESQSSDILALTGAISIFHGDSLIYSAAILPGRAYLREWTVCEER